MDYDNSAQDTSNYNDTYDTNSYSHDTRQDNYESNSYSHDTRQDNYESQHHGTHHDHYSSTKEDDSPKIPESKSVEFHLPTSTDDTSDLIDIQKDCVRSDSQESTPQLEAGNYENSIIDHFDSAFVNLQKDTGSINETENLTRNDSATTNQNTEKEDTDCCNCNLGPMVCLAFVCDCFGC